MAGNEQRPTDDVEGHGVKLPEDETTGEDRGMRFPDDVEGHIRTRQDTEAGIDRGGRIPDDTEGHGWRFGQDTEATEEGRGYRTPDDTEGHMPYRWGQDTEAVDEDQAGGDDTEGHIRF